jgi:GAF domain-containing protein
LDVSHAERAEEDARILRHLTNVAKPTEPSGGDAMHDLVKYFAEFATTIAVQPIDQVMDLVARAAVEVIDGCDHASISYTRGKTLVSASSNDQIGPLLDRIQTETQEGPCLDAIRTSEAVASADLCDDHRWKVYGPRACAETAVRSSAATPLVLGGKTMGAINLFADKPGVFGPEEGAAQLALAAVLAAHATPALASALHRDDMAQAVRTRDLIGQAKGLLMARSDIDDDAAFRMLIAASQRLNIKLVEVARRVVEGNRGRLDGS